MDRYEILGYSLQYFTHLAAEERNAMVEVCINPKYAVTRYVESFGSDTKGFTVKFRIVRGDNLISCWALREVLSQFTQSVADVLNEWGYRPPRSSHPLDSLLIPDKE